MEENIHLPDSTIQSEEIEKNIKRNAKTLSFMLDLFTGLKPESITVTCQANLNSIQTLLNNILKRSIRDFKRIRCVKFTPIQKSVFVQVLKIGNTELKICDWPTLRIPKEPPIITACKRLQLIDDLSISKNTNVETKSKASKRNSDVKSISKPNEQKRSLGSSSSVKITASKSKVEIVHNNKKKSLSKSKNKSVEKNEFIQK